MSFSFLISLNLIKSTIDKFCHTTPGQNHASGVIGNPLGELTRDGRDLDKTLPVKSGNF